MVGFLSSAMGMGSAGLAEHAGGGGQGFRQEEGGQGVPPGPGRPGMAQFALRQAMGGMGAGQPPPDTQGFNPFIGYGYARMRGFMGGVGGVGGGGMWQFGSNPYGMFGMSGPGNYLGVF